MEYTSGEGFALREVRFGWQWQETGARGWSSVYDTRQATLDALAAEFPCKPITLENGI